MSKFKFKKGDKVIYVGGILKLCTSVYTIEKGYRHELTSESNRYELEEILNHFLEEELEFANPSSFFKNETLTERQGPRLADSLPKDKLGERKNNGKLRWRNFPSFLIRPLVEVAHFGESKYTTFNFLKGQTVLDSLDSLHRHLDKFEDPTVSDLDEESQVNHLAHIAWNALVALYMLKTRPDLDDRYKGESK